MTKIVDDLGLLSHNQAKLKTTNNFTTHNIYTVKLICEHIFHIDISVISSKMVRDDVDVLIGMDVISMGDFCISNFNDKTFFSFRVPSMERIDLSYLKYEDKK